MLIQFHYIIYTQTTKKYKNISNTTIGFILTFNLYIFLYLYVIIYMSLIYVCHLIN